jgi:hypothetical protein
LETSATALDSRIGLFKKVLQVPELVERAGRVLLLHALSVGVIRERIPNSRGELHLRSAVLEIPGPGRPRARRRGLESPVGIGVIEKLGRARVVLLGQQFIGIIVAIGGRSTAAAQRQPIAGGIVCVSTEPRWPRS